eukprot:TRINITY_DN50014_c0_g1_i1.p1 TRINITY_DN50014_c0_g1~~TRINITY_DN50014_c0_g1_i1.p1  ORF type:complete len:464 (+),score=106.04 TRINITY_DN50014_c0_g1_i1:161-1393(+)
MASPISCRSPEESPREHHDPITGECSERGSGKFVSPQSSRIGNMGRPTGDALEFEIKGVEGTYCAATAAAEMKVDPKDNKAYTYDQIREKYSPLAVDAIQRYWNDMEPVAKPVPSGTAPGWVAAPPHVAVKANQPAESGPTTLVFDGHGPFPEGAEAAMTEALAAAASQEIGLPSPTLQQAVGAANSPPSVRQLARHSSGVDEEYIVVTAQTPISAFARGRGPTPQAAASGFCNNLCRIAYALEQLASRLGEQSPAEALSLMLRALALLEKALNVSLAEDDMGEKLRHDFSRMLLYAEDVGKQVSCTSKLVSSEPHNPDAQPAQPNAAIFQFAVQQAKEAAVVLSKGHEVGGWETPCHEKLTLALLLLDLLASEADGEDVPAIAGYTKPIARLVSEIERRMKSQVAKTQQ